MQSDPTTSTSLNHLPPEIFHRIFYHLDIPDILRLRGVSRYLNDISHGRDVWSDAYRKSGFIRPPGPFLFQSAVDLENTLIPSFHVDRYLREGGGTDRKEKQTRTLRQFRCTDADRGVNLVFGRFLLIALREEVHCYDLDLHDSDATVIYRSTGGTLRSFHCVSSIDPEGHPFACVVLNEGIRMTNLISIYLLNVGDTSEVTLDYLHQFEQNPFDILTVHLGPRVILVGDRVGHDVVALDVHTHSAFLLPSFSHAKSEAARMTESNTIDMLVMYTSISTSTHLLLALSFSTGIATGWKTFFQAFAIPSSDTHCPFTSNSTPRRLALSHRGIISGILVSGVVLLHDSVIDPATQDVFITIRLYPSDSSSRSIAGVLRLSAVHTSPGSDSEIGTIALQLLNSPSSVPGEFFQASLLHPSFNGIGRVFYMLLPGSDVVSVIEYDVRANDDDGAEREVRVVKYPSVVRFPTPRKIMDYDPYTGRICLRSATAIRSVIEILDFAA